MRKKFFTTVVLPPLAPLVILGFIGFFLLTQLVKNSLIEQLSRSAETTAARIEREFSIRKTILLRTAEEVIAIQTDFQTRRTTLANQRAGCLDAISKTGFGNFGFIGNPNCDPFLDEFARLINTQPGNINEYKNIYSAAVERDYNKELSALNAQENEKINDRFRSFTLFFPETLELAVIDNSEPAKVLAEPDEQEQKENVYVRSDAPEFSKVVTYEDKKVVAVSYTNIRALFDLSHEQFLKPSHDAAPKAYPEDSVIIIDTQGAAAYPTDSDPASVRTKSYVARESQISELNWNVLVASPSHLVLAPLRNAQLLAALAITASVAVSLIVGFVFVTSATNAIKDLSSGAVKFKQGDFDHKIYIATGDELEGLAETMNEMAAEIKRGREALIEKSKEFMSIASHELKAPLTGIIGYLSLIVDEGAGKVDHQAREFIEEAYESTLRLRDLVTELLDVARLEAKKTEFNLAPLDASSLIGEVVKNQLPAAREKKVKLIFTPKKLPRVLADKEKLAIVLTNFISNAIKYNKAGGDAGITQEINDKVMTITVADTGMGIPAAEQKELFKKFYRTTNAKKSGVSGTGLGLYITRQYIEGMGGTVAFESKPGIGTKFFFTLPVAN